MSKQELFPTLVEELEVARKERVKAVQKRHQQTSKFKATRKRYDQSPKGKSAHRASVRRDSQAPTGKARRKLYEQTPKAKDMRKRYKQSSAGRRAYARKQEKRYGVIIFLTNTKVQLGCYVCKCTDYWALEFHHRNPKEKLFTVGNFSVKGTWDECLERIIKEIAKCEIMCANCHRYMTRSF